MNATRPYSTDDKSTLVQVIAWCRQATSHYLSQCWPRSMSPDGFSRPQWVKLLSLGWHAATENTEVKNRVVTWGCCDGHTGSFQGNTLDIFCSKYAGIFCVYALSQWQMTLQCNHVKNNNTAYNMNAIHNGTLRYKPMWHSLQRAAGYGDWQRWYSPTQVTGSHPAGLFFNTSDMSETQMVCANLSDLNNP